MLVERKMEIALSVSPKYCGPLSVGTIGLIKQLRDQLGLSLNESKNFVDTCVFQGLQVTIPVPSGVNAETVVYAICNLETQATIEAKVITDTNCDSEA